MRSSTPNEGLPSTTGNTSIQSPRPTVTILGRRAIPGPRCHSGSSAMPTSPASVHGRRWHWPRTRAAATAMRLHSPMQRWLSSAASMWRQRERPQRRRSRRPPSPVTSTASPWGRSSTDGHSPLRARTSRGSRSSSGDSSSLARPARVWTIRTSSHCSRMRVCGQASSIARRPPSRPALRTWRAGADSLSSASSTGLRASCSFASRDGTRERRAYARRSGWRAPSGRLPSSYAQR